MSIINILRDNNIKYVTKGEHHHATEGWVAINCIWCGETNFSLGLKEEGTAAHCWKCGTHKITETISKLLDIPLPEAITLLKSNQITQPKIKIENKVNIKPFTFPVGTKDINDKHKKYLISRGFDPDEIVKLWGIKGTDLISVLDNINFRNRIIIPIYWDNNIVSYTSRGITGKATLRYITCPKKYEIIHHKNIIYCKQDKLSDIGICVEGIFDVWRLGFNAFATLGITYTRYQVRLISKLFKRVIILYDSEKQAIEQGKKLKSELEFRGVDCFIETLNNKKDPAELSKSEAKYIVKNLLKKFY